MYGPEKVEMSAKDKGKGFVFIFPPFIIKIDSYIMGMVYNVACQQEIQLV